MRASVRPGAKPRGRNARPPAHARAASLVVAVLLAVPPPGSRRAWGEILVLKADGERLPCRVLLKDEEKIVVRGATGTERTLQMSEVTDILPETSNVEVYEGGCEIMPRSGGLLPYHLGVWCLRNGMLQNGRRLLEFAAGDPLCAGRARFELAKSAKDPGERGSHLFGAVAADPSFQEAVKALAEEKSEAPAIPRETLLSLARALQDVCVGNNTRAYQKLQAIKAACPPAVIEALSSRLARGPGIRFEELMDRCGKGLSDAERAAGGGSGARTDCKNCDGSAFVVCDLCGGKGYTCCKTCNGRGVTTSTKRRTDMRQRIVNTRRCSGCAGRGYRQCRVCLRMPKAFARVNKTVQVEEPCPVCKGQGLVSSRREVKYTGFGRSGYSETVRVSCTRCSGRGSIVISKEVRMNGSGWRRCPICNKAGKIAFEGPPGMTRSSRYRRLTSRPPTTRGRRGTTADVRLAQEEVRRLKRFVSLLSYVTSGQADGLWGSGEKVPLRLSLSAAAAENELFFADGKWVTESMAKLRRQRARTLGHNPRKPDLSGFFGWAEKEELAFLREHSTQIGAGADPGASVTGLVSYLERTEAARHEDALDRTRVFRTVLLPDSDAGANGPAACRWSVRRMMGEEVVSLVLLRDPMRWPRLEVATTAVPEGGLDMGRLGGELLAAVGSPLTLYYRVTSCRRSSRGAGDAAVADVSLDVRVAAAVVGHEKRPKKVWIHGLRPLARGRR